MPGITIGADPELFVYKDGKPISAHNLIPGTKAKPHPVQNGAVQVDGMAVEFNITPSFFVEDSFRSINSVLRELRNMLPEDCTLRAAPVARFPRGYIDKQPDEAKELGCDPDFNAFTLKQNPTPRPHSTMRTAAGHVHIGWGENFDVNSEQHFMGCAHLVQGLEMIAGVMLALLEPHNDRTKMYGQPGAFRPKPYGVEWRSPSNFWLTHFGAANIVHNVCTHVANEMTRSRLTFPEQMAEQPGTGQRQGMDAYEVDMDKIVRAMKRKDKEVLKKHLRDTGWLNYYNSTKGYRPDRYYHADWCQFARLLKS